MSILEHVEALPPDPIFGLGERAKKDLNPHKVDLTLGVYHNEALQIETMRAVKEAEKRLLELEKNKTYLPISGIEDFVRASRSLVFGEAFAKAEEGRFMGIQTLGGTGGLRLGADFLKREVTSNIFFSEPTWANHRGIFEAAQMEIQTFPYYNGETHEVDFDRMLSRLAQAPEKSVVLLHACCHNPTGCDLNQEQWKELSSFMLKHKLIPFFDFAYQGFGRGIEEDPWAIRYFAEKGHELFVSHSFSKFFGLYGERTGALHVLVKDETSAKNSQTVLKKIVRVNYSNPPRHGASLAALVLNDTALRRMWEEELLEMRHRIEKMRSELSDALELKYGRDKFGFLKKRFGLFSMLGLTNEIVDHLIDDRSVYLTKSGRINLTGLNGENIPHVVDAIVKSLA